MNLLQFGAQMLVLSMFEKYLLDNYQIRAKLVPEDVINQMSPEYVINKLREDVIKQM
jgi:hypothetical protein